MNHRKHAFPSKPWILLAPLLTTPTLCKAAAPVYFDLGGLIQFAILYPIGFIVLLRWRRAKKSEGKKPSSLLLLCYLAIPAIIIATEVIKSELQHRTTLLNVALTKEHQKIFRAYCRDPQPIVREKVRADAIILQTRWDSDLSKAKWKFVGSEFATDTIHYRKPCGTSQTVIVEEQFKKCDNGNCSIEIRHHNACEKHQSFEAGKSFEIVKEHVAKYVIVFGEMMERVKVPRSEEEMSRIPVRIVDIHTAEVLGEDNLYFYGFTTGFAGCPYAGGTISKLISAVFSPE